MQTDEDRRREGMRAYTFLVGLEHKAAQAAEGTVPLAKPETIRGHAYPCGRNHPCPCGSGLKFKNCHRRLMP